MAINPPTQYATTSNLAARQRLWAVGRREPAFDLIPWVVELAGIGGGDERAVLDVGCGNGRYEQALVAAGHVGTRTAVDLSAGMLCDVTDATLVQGDVQTLPFARDVFDVVLAPHMLYHVPDVAAAARSMRRVLRPDGVMVAVTNSRENLGELRALVEAAAGGGWKMIRPSDQHFSVETGTAPLARGFASVERVDCPPSRARRLGRGCDRRLRREHRRPLPGDAGPSLARGGRRGAGARRRRDRDRRRGAVHVRGRGIRLPLTGRGAQWPKA